MPPVCQVLALANLWQICVGVRDGHISTWMREVSTKTGLIHDCIILQSGLSRVAAYGRLLWELRYSLPQETFPLNAEGKLGMVVCACNLSIQDMETGGSVLLAGGEPGLHSEILSPKQNNTQTKKHPKA